MSYAEYMKKFEKLVINKLCVVRHLVSAGTMNLRQLRPAAVKCQARPDTAVEAEPARAQCLAGSAVGGEEKSSSVTRLPLARRKPCASALHLGFGFIFR